MADPDAQAQLITVNEDGSLHVMAWHLDDDKAARLRELLGAHDHESVLLRYQAPGQHGVITIGQPDLCWYQPMTGLKISGQELGSTHD